MENLKPLEALKMNRGIHFRKKLEVIEYVKSNNK